MNKYINKIKLQINLPSISNFLGACKLVTNVGLVNNNISYKLKKKKLFNHSYSIFRKSWIVELNKIKWTLDKL